MRLLLFYLLVMFVKIALARDCEKLKVPFCSKMPYEQTRLPNIFGHEAQGDVNLALEPLQVLQDSGCFGHYSFMLCAALAPPCFPDEPTTPAPCRHVCERARDHCYGLMLMFNITEAFPDCQKLPDQNENPLCMTPTTLTPRDNCHCLKKHQPEKPTKELINNKDYDYSVKARMDGFLPSHFPSVLTVTVLDIFRDGIVQLTIDNSSYIRTNTSCKCPELQPGKEYLIMGHEDFNKTELLLSKDSYVVPWSDPINREYAKPAREEYQDTSRRRYSQRYNDYVGHHGYHLGFHRPSFSTLLMAGGAYALYRHYSNRNKLGKVYGYPGYGGYGSSFGALGGGGFGALGNPRGKYTNFNTYAAPPGGFGGNYGYNSYNPYSGYNSRPGYAGPGGFGKPAGQVPSYPITHKPNYATNRPNFMNRNPNPSYPVTKKPYRTSSGSSRSSSTSRSRSFGRRRSTSSNRSWGRRSSSSRSRNSYSNRNNNWNSRSTVWAPPTSRPTSRPNYPVTQRSRASYPATQKPRASYPVTQRSRYSSGSRASYPVTQRSRYSSSRSRFGGSSSRSRFGGSRSRFG